MTVIMRMKTVLSLSKLLIYNISLPLGTNPIGVDFLDSGRLQALGSFVGSLARLGFVDDSIIISTSTNYDLALEKVPSSKYLVPSKDNNDSVLGTRNLVLNPAASSTSSILHLLIDESRPFSETLENFSAFWQEYMSKATTTSAPKLSSVDMRYGSNIIYKTK
jgi:hypothetical protein